MNESRVSDTSIEEYHGDFDWSNDSISFDGRLDISAKATGNDGQLHEIGYSVDVSAETELSWVDDEDANYNPYTYAETGKIILHSLTPTVDATCYYDGDEVSLDTLRHNLPPDVQKQLINPQVISNLLEKYFVKKAENLEPDVSDNFEEPYRDSRY